MRLIDADILLEQMKHRRDYVGRPSDPVCLVEDAPTVDLPDALRAAGWREEGWVSVKDRLPNYNGIYLVWRSHYYSGEIEPVVCYFDGQNTWYADFERILHSDDITHWMPLPEPPKEEN